jgi:hypothetical protein
MIPACSTPDAEAAAIRTIFNEVAGNPALWKKSPMDAWQRLYDALRDTTAGLSMLAIIEEYRQTIHGLEEEISRLNNLVPQPPAPRVIP